MARNTVEGGSSNFPEGPTVRETDDPNVVAVPREPEYELDERDNDHAQSLTVGSDDAQTVNVPDSGTSTSVDRTEEPLL